MQVRGLKVDLKKEEVERRERERKEREARRGRAHQAKQEKDDAKQPPAPNPGQAQRAETTKAVRKLEDDLKKFREVRAKS